MDRVSRSIREAADRRAREWSESVDRTKGVGDRHHTVPVAYLRQFADGSAQLLVRIRENGQTSRRNMRDLAIKDFYTFVAADGELDGSIEQILTMVEGAVAPVLARLASPLFTPRVLSADEFLALAQFLSFQIVRGVGHRREIELMADFIAKTQILRDRTGRRKARQRAPGRGPIGFTGEQLAELRVVPHPNEHVKMIGPTAEAIFGHIVGRPATVVEVGDPLFITCDEPVLVNFDRDHVVHTDQCFETARERRIRVARELKKKGTSSQVLHVYPTRSSGAALADEIALTLSPRRLLVLGGKGEQAPPYVLIHEGGADLAHEVNGMLVSQAFDWIAAHPGHPTFADLDIPEPTPLIRACDGATPLSRALESVPTPRRPQRLRRDW